MFSHAPSHMQLKPNRESIDVAINIIEKAAGTVIQRYYK